MRCIGLSFCCCVLMLASVCAGEVKPCVNEVIRDRWTFPVTIECPFAIRSELLAQAVALAEKQSERTILAARIGHLHHPGFSPGLRVTYEDEVVEHIVIRRHVLIYFQKLKYDTVKGAASCGRDQFLLQTCELSAGKTRETKLNQFKIGKAVVRARLAGAADSKREVIADLLNALSAGQYLKGHGSLSKLKTLVGMVDELAMSIFPEAEQKRIFPEAFLPKKNSPKSDAEDDEEEIEEEVEEELEEWNTMRSRFRLAEAGWTAAELERISSIEFKEESGTFYIWRKRSKYSWEGALFKFVEGVWVMTSVRCMRRA